jgi:hypothetical protein
MTSGYIISCKQLKAQKNQASRYTTAEALHELLKKLLATACFSTAFMTLHDTRKEARFYI